MKFKFLKMAFAGLVLGVSGFANAGLILEVLRVDDSTAHITGSGSIDVADVFNAIILGGANSTGDAGVDIFTGDLSLGHTDINYVFTLFGTKDFLINLSSHVTFGDMISGFMVATLDVETWAAIGSTGFVTNDDSTILGSYTIVEPFSSVPEPSSLAIFALGLMGLASRRFKKKS